MSFLQKNEIFYQMWPWQPLKHFTAAYRGFPPCTQSQYPINRETGYSNVLAIYGIGWGRNWQIIAIGKHNNQLKLAIGIEMNLLVLS